MNKLKEVFMTAYDVVSATLVILLNVVILAAGVIFILLLAIVAVPVLGTKCLLEFTGILTSKPN